MPGLGLRGRRFSELNQVRLGVIALVTIVAMVVVALNIGAIHRHLSDQTYSADFAQGAGLADGDKVEVSGMVVGSVDRVELAGDHVHVTFSAHGIHLGSTSTAAIKTANVVGTRFLQIEPSGDGEADDIPQSRTSVPFNLEAALSDLTTTTGRLDTTSIARAMDTLSTTLHGTPTALHSTLVGISRISETINSRDAALSRLLDSADGVSRVLSQRSRQLIRVMANGGTFLRALDERRVTIHALLSDARAVSTQLVGLIHDNRGELGPVLHRLRAVIRLLRTNQSSLTFMESHFGGFARNLGESVGGGPFFYGYIQNIVPTQDLPALPGVVKGLGGAVGGTLGGTLGGVLGGKRHR